MFCAFMPPVMRPTQILALTGLSLSLLGTANADIETSIGAGYTSDYVFRGTNNGDDLFDASIDVSGSGNLGGLGDINLSAGLWLASYAGGNEMDLSLSASKSLSDNLSVAVGVTNYTYSGAGNTGANAADDLEPYISLGTSLGGISLGVGAHFNEGGDNDHDIYWEVTAGYEMELADNMTLGISGVIGNWDEVQTGHDDTYYGFSVGISIAVSDSITVTPHVSHTIDGNQTAADGTRSTGDETVAGVNVSFGF